MTLAGLGQLLGSYGLVVEDFLAVERERELPGRDLAVTRRASEGAKIEELSLRLIL